MKSISFIRSVIALALCPFVFRPLLIVWPLSHVIIVNVLSCPGQFCTAAVIFMNISVASLTSDCEEQHLAPIYTPLSFVFSTLNETN